MFPMLSRTLDLLFPPQCLSCRTLVAHHGGMCLECWQGVHFIADPCCARCGYPFEYSLGKGALCAGCIAAEPVFTQSRACFSYNAKSRDLILGYKYRDQTYRTPIYAEWLMKAGAELIARSEVIMPVPLHRRRMLSRRYNQAAELARSLSRKTKLPFSGRALIRTRNTAPQAHLRRKDRAANVKRAFTVPEGRIVEVRGKKILLIDDVLTTGATVNACAAALFKAGASEVNVLTLARKVMGSH